MKKINLCSLVSVAIAFGLVACERPESATKVRLVFDNTSSASSGTSQSVSALVGGGTIGSDGFGLSLPTAINDINCYAVFAGGPEPELENNSCMVGDAASLRTIKFGPKVGFVQSGDPIEFILKPGASRKFFVIGVKKTSTSSCKDLMQGTELVRTQISNPMLIGETVSNLSPGDNNVVITASIPANTADNLIKGCSFLSGPSQPPTSNPNFSPKLEVQGAISSFSPEASKVGTSTCNKLKLSHISGSGPLASSINVLLTTSNSSLGDFYSAPDCAAPSLVSSATIPGGQPSTYIYFKSSATAGTFNVSFQAADPSLNLPVVNRQVFTGSAPAPTQVRFFNDQVMIQDNGCAEVDYFLVDGASGYSSTGGSLAVAFLAQDNSGQSAPSGLQIKNSCAGSVVGGFPQVSAHGSIAIQMTGTKVENFKVGATLPSFLAVNPIPVAHKLVLGGPSEIFLSECLNLSANIFDSSNSPSNLSGYAFGYYPTINKSLNVNFFANTPFAQRQTSNQCNMFNGNPNFLFFDADLGSPRVYYKFSSPGTFDISAFAGQGQLTGPNQSIKQISVKWDPTYYQSMGTMMVSQYLPASGLGDTDGFPSRQNSNPLPTFNTSITTGGMVQTYGNDPIAGATSLQLGSGTFFTSAIGAGNISSGFTSIMMVRFDSIPNNSFLLSLYNGGVGSGGLVFDASGGLSLESYAGSYAYSPVASLALNQWVVISLSNDGTTCKARLNNAAPITQPCNNLTASNIVLGHVSSSPRYKLGEFYLINHALSDTEFSSVYQYYQQKYGVALFP